MDLKKLSRTRLSRAQFAIGVALYAVIVFAFLAILPLLDTINNVWVSLIFLVVVFYFGTIFPLSLIFRRLNDVGRSGWYIVLILVPFVNIALLAYLLFAKSSSETNAYGTPPETLQPLKILFG